MTRDRYPNTPGRFVVVRDVFSGYGVIDTHDERRPIIFTTPERDRAWREAERYNLAHLEARLVEVSR